MHLQWLNIMTVMLASSLLKPEEVTKIENKYNLV